MLVKNIYTLLTTW